MSAVPSLVSCNPGRGRRDSNPHDHSHMLLRHERLPFRHLSFSQWYLPSLTPLDSGFRQSDGVVHLRVDVRVDALYVTGVVFTTPVSKNRTSSSTALHRRRNNRDPGSYSARQPRRDAGGSHPIIPNHRNHSSKTPTHHQQNPSPSFTS